MVDFLAVTLIWGSTWLVIKGQLGVVAPVWSVSYRFVIASVVLAAFAAATGRWRWPTLAGHGFAVLVGTAQFVLNFNLVYAAETRLASGLVALVFALLVVPNTVLAAIFLKTRVDWRFAAGAVLGVAGLVLLFAPDLAVPAARHTAALGLLFVGGAVLCASVANVLQASTLARTVPPLPTLAVAMAYGAALRRRRCRRDRRAADVRSAARILAGAGVSRAGRVGASVFSLLPTDPADRAGTGGVYQRPDAGRRAVPVDPVRRLSLDRECGGRRGAGARRAGDRPRRPTRG